MNPKPLPARLKLGTASNAEADKLAKLLDFMRARERGGVPMMTLRATSPKEKYDTRYLVSAIHREQLKSRAGTTLFLLASLAAVAWWSFEVLN